MVSDWAACATPAGYDLTGAGRRHLHLPRPRHGRRRQHRAPRRTHVYTLDRSAPVAPIVTGATGADRTAPTPRRLSPPAAGTAQPAASSAARRSSATGRLRLAATTTCAQADGAYTFRVRATDAAGNTGAERPHVTLDRTTRPRRRSPAGRPAVRRTDARVQLHAEAGATPSAGIERGATGQRLGGCSTPQATTSPRRSTAPTPSASVRPTPPATRAPRHAHLHARPRRPGPPSITGAGRRRRERRHADVDVHRRGRLDLELPHRARRDGRQTGRPARGRAPPTSPPRSTAPTRSVSAPPTPPATPRPRPPTASRSTASPPWRRRCRGPDRPVERPGARVVVHRRGGRGDHLPRRARRDGHQRLGPVRQPALVRPLAAGRRRVHLPRPRDRRRAEHRRRRHPHVHPRPRRRRRADRDHRPERPSQDDTPTWGFTAEPGATTECRVVRGATEIIAWAPCATPHTFDIAARGRRRLHLRGPRDRPRRQHRRRRHPHLHARPHRSRRAAFTSIPAADSSDATPTWGLPPRPARRSSAASIAGPRSSSPGRACTTPHTPDLTAEVDGTYTLRVRATDAAGNTGADATSSYRSTASRRSRRRSPAARRPRTPGPRVVGGHRGGAASTCRVERGATVIDDWGPAPTRARTTSRSSSTAPTPSASARLTPRATRAPTAPRPTPWTARAHCADDDRRPERPVAGRHADVGVHGRDRRDDRCRVVRGATEVIAWTPCTSPRPSTSRRGRRHLHVRGPRDRPRREHRRRRHAHLHARPHRPGGADVHRAAAADSSDDTPTWPAPPKPADASAASSAARPSSPTGPPAPVRTRTT